jgi:hypothetical protein
MLHPASPLVEFAAAQVPLFADPQREYHWVECFDAWERGGNTVTFAARNEAGQPLTVRLTFVEPAVLRVQLLTPGAAEPPSTPMLVAAEWPRVAIGVEEQGAARQRGRPAALPAGTERPRLQQVRGVPVRVLDRGRFRRTVPHLQPLPQ